MAPPLPEASQPSSRTHSGGPTPWSPVRPPSTSRSCSSRVCAASRRSASSLRLSRSERSRPSSALTPPRMPNPVPRPLPPKPDFPRLEEEVLQRWRERDVFHESVRRRQGAEPYVFYEGPPTANGRPGSHHVLARAFKDIFPRYQTMRGRYVERKGGWDCHGLPVEIAVEQKLGFTSKDDIERYGIAEFNAKCRESVFEFLEDWNALTERIGFWVDLDDPYRTLEPSYIESVWWALKTMWERELLYEGYKVVPYCARCGTALSSHEVSEGYKDVEDPSVYVRVPGDRRRGRAAARRPDPGLDHHAVDAALQRRPGRLARPRVRAHRGRPRDRRGARRGRARRGGRGRGPLPRARHARRPLRAAVHVHRHRGVRPEGPHRRAGGLRQRRGRHRRRAHVDLVRRGRLPDRPRAGHRR